MAAGRLRPIYKTKDGKRVPSVTTILGVIDKPALVPWANRMGRQGIDTRTYVDELAAVGTLAHYRIECLLTERRPDFTGWTQDQMAKSLHAVVKFREWASDNNVEVIATELPLVSEVHRYGGMIDVLAKVNGVPAVIDIKTGKAVYDDHRHQVAAYFHLAAQHGYAPRCAYVVQAGRTEAEGFSVSRLDRERIDRHWRVFCAAYGLYDAIKAAKRKR